MTSEFPVPSSRNTVPTKSTDEMKEFSNDSDSCGDNSSEYEGDTGSEYVLSTDENLDDISVTSEFPVLSSSNSDPTKAIDGLNEFSGDISVTSEFPVPSSSKSVPTKSIDEMKEFSDQARKKILSEDSNSRRDNSNCKLKEVRERIENAVKDNEIERDKNVPSIYIRKLMMSVVSKFGIEKKMCGTKLMHVNFVIKLYFFIILNFQTMSPCGSRNMDSAIRGERVKFSCDSANSSCKAKAPRKRTKMTLTAGNSISTFYFFSIFHKSYATDTH